MKSLTLLVIIIILFSSCKPAKYVQVYETTGLDTKLENALHTFENDTVKILYMFNNREGVMAFIIHNKLNRPIYIDWSKSWFSDNTNKLIYSKEAYSTDQTKYLTDRTNDFVIAEDTETHNMIDVEMKRTTAFTKIEPGLKYSNLKFNIAPELNYELKNYSFTEVPLNDSPEKITKLYEENFTEADSPLHFSNRLTFYLHESLREEFYIENQFYVSKVIEMAQNHFRHPHRDQQGKKTKHYQVHYGFPTFFHLVVDKEYSVEGRK